MSVDRIVRELVSMATGIDGDKVIPGNDPHPAPQGLYASVLRISEDHPGTPEVRYGLDGDDVRAKSKIWLRGIFSIQFYRSGAVDAATALRAWAFSPLGIEAQRARRTHIASLSETRRLDILVQDAPEERASVDMDIDTPLTIEQNVGRVRTIPTDNNLDGVDRQTGEINAP